MAKKEKPADDKFLEFLAQKSKDPILGKDSDLKERFEKVQSKMIVLLELNVAIPRSAAIQYSLLNAEIVKQAILRYKFWLDEPFSAYDNDGDEANKEKPKGINKARQDIGKGEMFAEMEYWSENHYIMFASSEYLAGQLWETETFSQQKIFWRKTVN